MLEDYAAKDLSAVDAWAFQRVCDLLKFLLPHREILACYRQFYFNVFDQMSGNYLVRIPDRNFIKNRKIIKTEKYPLMNCFALTVCEAHCPNRSLNALFELKGLELKF